MYETPESVSRHDLLNQREELLKYTDRLELKALKHQQYVTELIESGVRTKSEVGNYSTCVTNLRNALASLVEIINKEISKFN